MALANAALQARPDVDVVVTVTSSSQHLEDALQRLSNPTSMALQVNQAPVMMVASVAQPQACGGGWVAPSTSL